MLAAEHCSARVTAKRSQETSSSLHLINSYYIHVPSDCFAYAGRSFRDVHLQCQEFTLKYNTRIESDKADRAWLCSAFHCQEYKNGKAAQSFVESAQDGAS